MMNDQDRELIAALAEERLSGRSADDALARIEADPDLASEYAEQVAALAFLRSGRPPEMTASERSTLHVNLEEQLGLLPGQTPAPASARRSIPWWQPLFGLATAAVVVTAIVVLPGTFLGGSSDSAGDEVAISEFDASGGEELQTVTTQSSAGMADAPESRAEDGQNLDDDIELSVFETDSVGLVELLKRARGADSPDAVEEQLSGLTLPSTVRLDAAEVERCTNDLADELPQGIIRIHVLGADVQGATTIVHLGLDFGSGVDAGVSVDLSVCEIVDSDS